MSLVEDLQREFEAVGEKVNNDILLQCNSLCKMYNISVEILIDEWLAHAVSHSVSLQPTIEELNRLERTVLRKKTYKTEEPEKGTPAPVQTQEIDLHSNAPSEDFHKRANAREVINKIGQDTDFKRKFLDKVTIKANELGSHKLMYEKFSSQRATFNHVARKVFKSILEANNLELSNIKLNNYSGEVIIAGQISSPTLGKLDQTSIYLCDVANLYKGQSIRLNLQKVDKLRLFPGQNVVLSGKSMRDWFLVEKIYTQAPLEQSPLELKETLQIVVACGPFTTPTNLLYEPLNQLLDYVLENKPNVLILIGPFVEPTSLLTQNYYQFFENMIGNIAGSLKGLNCQIVIVPSHKDAFNPGIIPSPRIKLKKTFNGVFLAPNPFIINIEGLNICGTSADILFDIAKAEFSRGISQDRMRDIASQILNQKCFYPLYPPGDIGVDYTALEDFEVPHLLILPSNLRNFVKIVEDCVVINPERLTKGNGGGTFARIEVRSGNDGKFSEKVSCIIQAV